MCGIVGISAESNVAGELYDSMLMLQHRGQDAAGMVVSDNKGRLNSRKSKTTLLRGLFECFLFFLKILHKSFDPPLS